MDKLIHIFQFDYTNAKNSTSRPEDVHNHDFEELLIGIEGSIEHYIDFEKNKIEVSYISFITKGKVHKIIPRAKNGQFLAWVIRFKSEFISEMVFHLYILFQKNANIQLTEGRHIQRLQTMCEMMNDELDQEQPNYGIVQNLLRTLFIMIECEMQKQIQDINTHQVQNTTFIKFLQILEDNFSKSESVKFYSKKLFMSSRNLNLICNKICQQSVSDIIETRKLIEAKNLLVGTNKTISEIAYQLGYNEKSYFSKVFKKKAGQTPSDFRYEMKNLIK
ncbi:AraC family transcriptional regulator [Lutibacter sp. B1]|uniref:helix-turn-helix domain-containing protein n=1 Tax=Lutibacter sp. B1 TaxID=2725996 RepID=UPI0014567714|nr:AraC family transcriptional regulator [Lutibacter sp. B1]NLP59257.1 helix-turn-helix domain-containing protein [Lutibacter sp. B1]